MSAALGDRTWQEVGGSLLALPIGSCEQHGPHLPLDTDTRIAIALANRLAELDPRVVVAPAIAITASGEHEGFAGTLSIGRAVLEAVLVETVRSARWSAGTVFVNGHGGNVDAVRAATDQLRTEHHPVLPWWPPVADGDAHAGRTETSLLLEIAPEVVRLERAEPGCVTALSELMPVLVTDGVRAVSPNGVLGDPAGASAAEGRRLLDSLAADLHRRGLGMEAVIRCVLDTSSRRVGGGRVLIGGSPLKLFRLSEGGAALIDAIERGEPIPATASNQALIDRLLDAGAADPQPAPGPSPDQVTVVIPAYDTDQVTLQRLVGSCGAAARTIVVDDASPTPIAPVGGAVVIRRDSNGGPGAARMTGLDRVDSPLVAFVDTDVDLSPDWLSLLLRHAADERVAAVAPRVSSIGPDSPIARYESRRSPLDLGPRRGRVRAGTRLSYVPAAVLLCRVSAIRQVGGFDPSLRVGEDVDLIWKFDEAGHRVRYEPSCVVHHHVRPDLRAWLRQRYTYGTSGAPLAIRHPGTLAPVRVSGWSAAAWASAACGWPIVGGLIAAVTTALLARKLRDVPDGPREAIRLAGLGHLYAGRSVASGVTRAWWPLAMIAAAVSRRCRRAVLLAALAPPLIDWAKSRPPLDPVRYVGLRLLDDASYGAGLAVGCVAARNADALVPDFTSWPKTKR